MRKRIVFKNYFRLMVLSLLVLTAISAVSVTPASAGGKWEKVVWDVGPLGCSPDDYNIYWYFEGHWKIIHDDWGVYYFDWAFGKCYYYTDHPDGKELHGYSNSGVIIDWSTDPVTLTYRGIFFKGRTADGERVIDIGPIVTEFDTDIVLEMRGRHDLTSGVDVQLNDLLPDYLAPD